MINEESIRRCLDVLMNIVLEPALTKMEAEGGQRICVNVQLIHPQKIMFAKLNSCQASDAKGEIRVIFKESFAGPIRFECQAIIRGYQPSTGFSGFSMDGKIDLLPTGDKVRLKGRTNYYNQWEWRSEFIIA